MPFDEVELSNARPCLGRLYFHVPGGITYGQHWLNVKFEKSLVRVPFRILTEEEERFLEKNSTSPRPDRTPSSGERSRRRKSSSRRPRRSGLFDCSGS